jgi:hypothetical protein
MTVIQMSGQELTRLRIMIDVADGRLTVESAASLKVWGGSRAEAARSIKHAALHSQGNLAKLGQRKLAAPTYQRIRFDLPFRLMKNTA